MPYPTLLLLLDDDRRADARNDAAIEFALRAGAHIHGLSCHIAVPTGPEFAVAPGGPNDPVRRNLEEERRQAIARASRFRADCERRGVASCETSIDDSGEPGRALLGCAPLHDLLLLGQPDPLEPDSHRRSRVLEDVVLRSPRPTLLLPHAGEVTQHGRTAVIAWDGSHGAARAASDALPLLKTCREVRVVQIENGPPQAPQTEGADLAGVERWLARHGVAATSSIRHADGDIGLALLSTASDVGADLLVMGSWGRGRWKERLLGGVTQTVIAHMALPVLTSH